MEIMKIARTKFNAQFVGRSDGEIKDRQLVKEFKQHYPRFVVKCVKTMIDSLDDNSQFVTWDYGNRSAEFCIDYTVSIYDLESAPIDDINPVFDCMAKIVKFINEYRKRLTLDNSDSLKYESIIGYGLTYEIESYIKVILGSFKSKFYFYHPRSEIDGIETYDTDKLCMVVRGTFRFDDIDLNE
jgi:hypothetical protein